MKLQLALKPTVLAAALLVGGAAGAIGASDLSDAGKVLSSLNPATAMLGGLIDKSIDKANEAAAERMRQAETIMLEAAAVADGIAHHRIGELDEVKRQGISQMARGAAALENSLSNDLRDGLTEMSKETEARIRQLQVQTAQVLVNVTWLNVEPVLNDHAIQVYRQAGTDSTISVTGVGLFKGGIKPKAFLINGPAAVELEVPSYSNIAFEVRIPNKYVQTTGSTQLNIRLEVSNGRHVDAFRWAPDALNVRTPMKFVLPVVVGVLDRFDARIEVLASGQIWERKTSPKTNASADGIAYVPSSAGQDAQYFDIRPLPDYGDGFEVDTALGYAGLKYDSCNGANEHSCTFGEGRLRAWTSSRHSDRGGDVKVGGIAVFLRRPIEVDECKHIAARETRLTATEPVQAAFNRTEVLGPCAEPGLKAKPSLRARVTVRRNGQHEFVLVIPEGQRLSTPDGVAIALNSEGVVTIRAPMTFHWKTPPYEVPLASRTDRRDEPIPRDKDRQVSMLLAVPGRETEARSLS